MQRLLKLSPSKLVSFEKCQRRGQVEALKERDNLKTIYGSIGTAVHRILDDINRGEKLTASERLEKVNDYLFEECKKDGILPQSTPGYTDSLDFISTYEVPENWKFIEGEIRRELIVPFRQSIVSPTGESKFDAWRLGYLIDALFEDTENNRLIIVDYKSTAKMPKTAMQLNCYAWAEIERFKGTPQEQNAPELSQIDGYFWNTRKGGKLANMQLTAESILKTRDFMQTAAESIRMYEDLSLKFPETPGDCKFCPFLDCSSREDNGW